MPYRALLLCFATLCLQSALPSFQKIGQGPGILFIHGFGGNKEVWSTRC
jgi:pimeloyl-ACP methyl ester carboxylesterase